MIRKHGWRVDRALHNYVYFVFYYPYVFTMNGILRFVSKYLGWFRPLALVFRPALERYHSKVLSYGDTEKIFTINEDLRAVSDKNRQIVPFRYAHKIILAGADHVALMDCPCKKTLGDEEWALQSCIAVGRDLTSFWLEHGKKYNVKKITGNQALELVRKFRGKGYLTQAFFKVATGGSTGVICNCRPESCVSLQATKTAKQFDRRLTMNADAGYAVARETEACRYCGTCEEICPVDVIEVKQKTWEYNRDGCIGCELCVEHCPEKALSLFRDPDKPVPLDLDIVRKDFTVDDTVD